MRLIKLVVAAAMVVGSCGCNSGQPRIYKIAINRTPLASLPTSCYRNNTPDNVQYTGENLREDAQWVIWDGTDKQYLDIGKFSVRLGDADPIDVGSMIEGSDKVFDGTLVENELPTGGSSYSHTKTLSAKFTFEEMGAVARGSIDLSSTYSCTNCNNNDDKLNCAAKLTFIGRKIDETNMAGYSPTGQ
jgi:hypothetical protein